jgi:hypothetical protein
VAGALFQLSSSSPFLCVLASLEPPVCSLSSFAEYNPSDPEILDLLSRDPTKKGEGNKHPFVSAMDDCLMITIKARWVDFCEWNMRWAAWHGWFCVGMLGPSAHTRAALCPCLCPRHRTGHRRRHAEHRLSLRWAAGPRAPGGGAAAVCCELGPRKGLGMRPALGERGCWRVSGCGLRRALAGGGGGSGRRVEIEGRGVRTRVLACGGLRSGVKTRRGSAGPRSRYCDVTCAGGLVGMLCLRRCGVCRVTEC